MYKQKNFRGVIADAKFKPHCSCCRLILDVDVGYSHFTYYLHNGRLGRPELVCYFGEKEEDYKSFIPGDVGSLLSIHRSDIHAQVFVKELGLRELIMPYSSLAGN